MHPASKSKSKEMSSPKAGKEQKAYDPLSGTFRNLDEMSELSADYDVLSNNGSSSGESEEHKDNKPPTTNRQETTTLPTISDNDKREKIRQQNEKKHQRQKERRAQELHERCTGYLMSRKLDSLSQQLVAMGISSERATLALMLNQGRLEESVNWLFEVNEEEVQQRKDYASGSNLKLDISEELARVSELVVRYKCSKQEVERVVVGYEGDLQKAEETLRSQKPEQTVIPPKPEELIVPKHQQIRPPPEKPAAPVALVTAQPNRAVMGTKSVEPRSRNLQPTRMQSSEKRWAPAGSSSKVAAHPNVGSGGGNEGRSFPVTEPVIMMQRQQSMNVKQNTPVTKPISKVLQNQNTGGYVGYNAENMTAQHHSYPQPKPNRNIGPEKINAQPYYPQTKYHNRSQMGPTLSQTGSMESVISRLGPTLSPMGGAPNNAPSSLGLFSGWGSTIDRVDRADWNERNGMYSCDYNTIDWTSEWSNWTPKVNREIRVPRNNMGLQKETSAGPSAGVPREWTSPFAGSDLFSLPRQFVTSPSP